MENNDIDRLFKEELRNLEATPSKRVWNNIESNLKKKKRRTLPIWWFSGGVAAVLIVGFLLFHFSNNLVNNIKNAPIIIASPEISTPNLKPIKTNILIKNKQQEIIIAEETKVFKKKENLSKIKSYKTVFLVDNKSQKNVADKKVIKNTTEKKYLANNSTKEHIEAINNKTIIVNEDVLLKTKKPSDLTKKTELIDNNKSKKKYIKKDILVVLNNIKKEEIKKKKLWTVSPVVAILNSKSFSKSSPISKSLGNSRSGDNSYSYGIQVSYELDNKWTIQSGIHLQEMHFSNNEVVINTASSSVSNVSFNSGDTYSLEDSSLGSLSLNSTSKEANLSQVYGYIEIPVEIKYNVLENRKFKTELVAGFSSLFLNKNAIDLKANNFTKIGKANNLNNINFSGNFGIDFNYQFDKKWSLNINPMFKTQLNTFNKNTNGFKPYFIGIYTGLNYQF